MVVPSPTCIQHMACPIMTTSRAEPVAKAELRRALRKARREHMASLPASVRGLILNRPPQPVVEMLADKRVVGLYHPVGAEAPSLGWARWLHENGHHIALPWFSDREAAMQFRLWSNPWDDALLEPSPHGGMQPVADDDAAGELSPQAVVVPLVGFTADCHRLGQGGGHYDRWLDANPDAIAIGLAWDVQCLDELPQEPHDRVLNAVVTPTRIYRSEA